jgi:hypothetical protein
VQPEAVGECAVAVTITIVKFRMPPSRLFFLLFFLQTSAKCATSRRSLNARAAAAPATAGIVLICMIFISLTYSVGLQCCVPAATLEGARGRMPQVPSPLFQRHRTRYCVASYNNNNHTKHSLWSLQLRPQRRRRNKFG